MRCSAIESASTGRPSRTSRRFPWANRQSPREDTLRPRDAALLRLSPDAEPCPILLALVGQWLHLPKLSKLLERDRLELARSLARKPEPLADFRQRLRLGAVEAEAECDPGALALAQQRQPRSQHLLAERAVHTLLWLRAVAGDHVSEEGIFLRNERLIETGRGASRRLDIERLPKREARSFGHLLQRGLPPELHREHALRPVELLPPLDHVHRHPDRAGLFRKAARHRLADPPGRIGGELVTPAPVELVDRAHQA